MRLRYGAVGTAFWGRTVHLPGLKAAGVEVAGIWGRNAATVAEIAREQGVRAFASFEELLDNCDVVSMAVPPDVQAVLALQAAHAGKHLILEKPIARDLASARAIAEAMKARNLAGLVFFLRRYIREVEAAIAAERDHAWNRADIRVHTYVMGSPSPYSGSVWRQAAGAALWDIGPHVLSVLIPMLGNVVAIECALPDEHGVTRFKTWHDRGGVAESSVTLHGAPDAVTNRYVFKSASREIELPNPDFSRVGAFKDVVLELNDAIATGRRDLPRGIDLGVTTVEWLVKAEESRRTGRVVRLKKSSL